VPQVNEGGNVMGAHESSACCNVLRVGDSVPDFELDTYDPVAKNFGKFSMQKQKESGRWTVLFFYPADFTFV